MQLITKKQSNGVMIIYLNGRLDTTTSAGVQKQINELIDAGETQLILNFKDLDYISSAGLRILIATIKLLQQRQGQLVLSAIKERIYEILDIAGFTAIFNIKNSDAEALTEFA